MLQQPGKKILFNENLEPGKHRITHEFNGEVVRKIKINQKREGIRFCNMTMILRNGFATRTTPTTTTSTTTTSSTTTGKMKPTSSVYSK